MVEMNSVRCMLWVKVKGKKSGPREGNNSIQPYPTFSLSSSPDADPRKRTMLISTAPWLDGLPCQSMTSERRTMGRKG